MDKIIDDFNITLSSPMTEEDWDFITDVDFDKTTQIAFYTKHGKKVVFKKQRIGKWISRGIFYCSECDMPSMQKWPYCEQCGAEMEEE